MTLFPFCCQLGVVSVGVVYSLTCFVSGRALVFVCETELNSKHWQQGEKSGAEQSRARQSA